MTFLKLVRIRLSAWCSCREMSPFPPETKGSDTRIRRFNGYPCVCSR